MREGHPGEGCSDAYTKSASRSNRHSEGLRRGARTRKNPTLIPRSHARQIPPAPRAVGGVADPCLRVARNTPMRANLSSLRKLLASGSRENGQVADPGGQITISQWIRIFHPADLSSSFVGGDHVSAFFKEDSELSFDYYTRVINPIQYL